MNTEILKALFCDNPFQVTFEQNRFKEVIFFTTPDQMDIYMFT